MKKSKLLDSIGYVDSQLINEADTYVPAKKKNGWLKWGAMAACLCLVLAGTFGVNKYYHHLQEQMNPTDNTEGTQNEGRPPVSTAEGLYIPAFELPEKVEGVALDMIGLVVYNGNIYTQAEDYYDDEALRIESLVGDYLGYASGSIDEWSKQEEYAHDFASSVAGKVYSVKGYDTDFRICIREETRDENGEPTLWIQFLDRLNGITLATGEDLFENKLHIRDRVESIQWQGHDDWNLMKENLQDADIAPALWKEFLTQIDKGKFIYTWTDDNRLSSSNGTNKSIYDTQNQAHLILTMKDGTVIRLRLIEGGYVGYDALGWYFVQIPGETFDAVYAACGGTHME